MWTELPYGKIYQNIKQVAMTAVITTVVSIFAALWILLLIKKDIDKQ